MYKGEKVDISYFNGEQSNYLLNDDNIHVLASLKYSCFKGNKLFPFIKKSGCVANYRELINPSTFLFHGTYNLIPLVVMDLLLHNPSKVKIFHADLMLTRERYDKYYSHDLSKRNQDEISSKFRLSTITHDPVSQYRLLKSLYDKGKICGDDAFSRVMSLGEVSYSKELQDKYSVR